MSRIQLALITAASTLALSACSAPDDTADTTASDPAPADTSNAMDRDPDTAQHDETMPAPEQPPLDQLANVLAGEWRGEAGERDAWRHPAETLEFFGIDPSGTIVEIWPGGGWYTDVLAPWINANGGHYVAAHFAADSDSDYRQRSRAHFEERVADTALYGAVDIVTFNSGSGALAEPGSVDAVLTFRNVHNWLMYGWSEKAFNDFYAALRPGGVLGVVDHRLPSTREQDPHAGSGYVQQAYVIALAEEAGFEFVGASEVNANPADTADHPFGVWTLPPTRRSAPRGQDPAADFDRAGFDAIGESDRMTLLFRKPETDATSGE